MAKTLLIDRTPVGSMIRQNRILDWCVEHSAEKPVLLIDRLTMIKHSWPDVIEKYKQNVLFFHTKGTKRQVERELKYVGTNEVVMAHPEVLEKILMYYGADKMKGKESPFSGIAIADASIFKDFRAKRFKIFMHLVSNLKIDEQLTVLKTPFDTTDLWSILTVAKKLNIHYHEFNSLFMMKINHFGQLAVRPNMKDKLRSLIEKLSKDLQ